MLKVIKRTPKTAEQIRIETLEELTEMGFGNLPTTNADETAEAIFEQIDNDTELHDKVIGVLIDYYADNYEFCKETCERFMEKWVFEQADYLHA